MRMKNPPHPGLSVRADCLEALGLNVTEGTKALGASRQALNNLIHGQAAISPEMVRVTLCRNPTVSLPSIPVNATRISVVTGIPRSSPIWASKTQWSAPVSRIDSIGGLFLC